jgi:hypothetical protein
MLAVLLALALWETYLMSLFGVGGVVQAIAECMQPTITVPERGYLPTECVLTREEPPPALVNIVEGQKSLYHLSLQNLTVCRSGTQLRAFEARFAGLPFGDADQCRPLSKGCCSCQSGRQVIVMAADPSEGGSILVRAVMIQRRSEYLRSKWDAVEWDVVAGGTLLFIGPLLAVLVARPLVRSIRGARLHP